MWRDTVMYSYFISFLLFISLELGSSFYIPTRATTTTPTRIASSLLFTSSSSDDTKNVVDQDEIGNKVKNNNHVAMREMTTAITPIQQKTKRKIAILLCPAQFCVPADYETFLTDISTYFGKADTESSSNNASAVDIEIVAARVAPLPRTEWIKVAKQLPTLDFINGNLSVRKTLDWYFHAMDKGLSDLLVDIASSSLSSNTADDIVEICIIGHSIGGWVARAYIGGLSSPSSISTAINRLLTQQQQQQQPQQQYKNVKISSLITLGTPHTSSPNAIVDQTRGLLREIEMSHTCSAKSLVTELGISILCVGSSSIYCFGSSSSSSSGGSRTSFIENIIATASYLPLLGNVNSTTCGDGIVPYELSYITDNGTCVQRINIQQCLQTGKSVQHANVIPTPWNIVNGYAPSYKLSSENGNNIWYGSPGVLGQWIEYI